MQIFEGADQQRLACAHELLGLGGGLLGVATRATDLTQSLPEIRRRAGTLTLQGRNQVVHTAKTAAGFAECVG